MAAASTIPDNMLDGFSMGGKARIEFQYEDASSEEIQLQINENFTKQRFDDFFQRILVRDSNYYGDTDQHLYSALEKYPISGKRVCVIGSTCPWYEAIAVAYGCSECVVLEYCKRQSFDDSIVYKQPHEPIDGKFDVCFCISSVEHDGLGRYGDPLDPDGDIKAMKGFKGLLSDGGTLFLAVPIGLDKVVFNLHRVYGEARLPLLLDGWREIDRFGFNENSFRNDLNGAHGTPYQPVLVLQ